MTTDTEAAEKYTDPFEVLDYDPRWADIFAEESKRIHGAIGDYIIEVEHVGSTSIPGLAAKPIIDIQIVVKDFSQLNECIEGMKSAGYRYKGLCGIEGREYFKRPNFHAHMVQINNEEYARKKLFLKYLREHEDARNEYSALKKQLIGKWLDNPKCHIKYNFDKTDFIMGVLEKAGWDADKVPLYIREHRERQNKGSA
ncbi:hypothetical protein GGI12_003704 [Dipsacomyces acuminosporus]|nr:hypothetical protein GGI12_003704 [Dipsacomyces acuminosporus]